MQTLIRCVRSLGVIALVFGALIVVVLVFIRGPRTVAQVETPDGTVIRIRQHADFGDLWEATSLEFRKPGGQWMWLYYDHEAYPWFSAKISLDASNHLATVYRQGKATAIFDWEAGAYSPKLSRWSGEASLLAER